MEAVSLQIGYKRDDIRPVGYLRRVPFSSLVTSEEGGSTPKRHYWRIAIIEKVLGFFSMEFVPGPYGVRKTAYQLP
jgi:hypothetical protein